VNEHELAKQAQLQAIFETGARITHDIKNLLQSMHSMVTILHADTSETDSKSVIILKRQFPYFIQRLEQAMNKLQTPEEISQEITYLKEWWGELHSHYKDYDIEFIAEIDSNPAIPFDLFHSVAENLLENAITKRKEQPDIRITAKIQVNKYIISMKITDTGNAIDERTATILFRESIKSDNGLGIGLLQAAKQAEAMGYTLSLKYNFNGNVCFELHN
jgi:signal transduction histidine kinase